MITEWNGELDKIGKDVSEGIAGWVGAISAKDDGDVVEG
jgi:hypothetical protein